MADLGEAFNSFKQTNRPFHTIDYFFTQRSLTEEQEFIDHTMTRQIKKIKVVHNFLALNIPTVILNEDLSNSKQEYSEKPLGFDIEIYGDDGYSYKGTITSYQGVIPNFMIPIKGDKKLFVNISYKYTNNDGSNGTYTKKYINFIDVPKRFQLGSEIEASESETPVISQDNKKSKKKS
jgi:hypothetical protein